MILESESKTWDKNKSETSGKFIYSIYIYWGSTMFQGLSLGPDGIQWVKHQKGALLTNYSEQQAPNHNCPGQTGKYEHSSYKKFILQRWKSSKNNPRSSI